MPRVSLTCARIIFVAALALAFLAGCKHDVPVAPEDAPPPVYGQGPPPPPPPPSNYTPKFPDDCLDHGGYWYVASHDGWLVYNMQLVNRCDDQPLRFRMAVNIYERASWDSFGPDKYVGSNRHQRTFRESVVWLCGDGWLSTACSYPVRYPGPPPEYGNLAHHLDWNLQVCLPEEPCPWPDYPERR